MSVAEACQFCAPDERCALCLPRACLPTLKNKGVISKREQEIRRIYGLNASVDPAARLPAVEANERFGAGQQAAYALEAKLARQYEASLLATGRRCVGAYRARTQVLTAAFDPSKHPHLPGGSSKGGEWAPVDYTTNSALDEYTKGGMHGPAARLLRGNPKTNETLPKRVAETTDFIHRLDAQFASEGEILKKAETVYRGTQIAPVNLPIPGDSWVEPGYTSTTSNIESNYLKSGGTRLIISLPPGTQVLRANEFNEHETLLPRGAKFTITDIDGDYWHVILDGFEPKPLPLTAAMPPKPEGDPQDPSQPPQPTVDEVLDAKLAAASAEARTLATRRKASAAVAGEILSGFDSIPELRPLLEPLVRRQAGAQAERLVAGVRDAVQNVLLDALLEGWSVDTTAEYLGEVLKEQAKWRATMLARTDLIALSNGAAQDAVLVLGSDGPQFKTWVTAGDERVREDHQLADRQTVGTGEPFNVGGAMLQYPGDPLGPDSEIINCRCAHVFSDTATPVLRHSFEGGNLMSDQLAVAASGFDPSKHPRHPKGDERGGEFASKDNLGLTHADLDAIIERGGEYAYHTTSPINMDSVLTKGLLPQSGMDSNFDEGMGGTVREGQSYLFIPRNKAEAAELATEQPLRIEMRKLDPAAFRFDEDLAEIHPDWNFSGREGLPQFLADHPELDQRDYLGRSIEKYGTTAYNAPIPPDAIERTPGYFDDPVKAARHEKALASHKAFEDQHAKFAKDFNDLQERVRSTQVGEHGDYVWDREGNVYRRYRATGDKPEIFAEEQRPPIEVSQEMKKRGVVSKEEQEIQRIFGLNSSAATDCPFCSPDERCALCLGDGLDVLLASFDPAKHPHKPRGAGGGQWARAAQVAAEAAADGVTMDVTETDGVLKLNKIVSEHHGEGNASEALDELVEYADEAGKPVFLNPSSLGGLTQEQLVAWYRRHGFAPVGKGMVHDRNAAVVAAIAPFLVAAAFDPSKHPRNPGSGADGVESPSDGGKFRAAEDVTPLTFEERRALRKELYPLKPNLPYGALEQWQRTDRAWALGQFMRGEIPGSDSRYAGSTKIYGERELAEVFQDAIKESPGLSRDVRVYYGGNLERDRNSGGFLPVSIDPEGAKIHGKLHTFVLPKGTKALWLGGEEDELLLGPTQAKALRAAAWDESKHPRDPGGKDGGRWIPKGSDWMEFAKSGVVRDALEGKLKPLDTDDHGNPLTQADIDRMTSTGAAIEGQAQQGQVTVDLGPDKRTPRFFGAPESWTDPNGSLFRGERVNKMTGVMGETGFTTHPLTSTVDRVDVAKSYATSGSASGVPVVYRFAPNENGTHRGVRPVLDGVPSGEVVMPGGVRYRVVSKPVKGAGGVWFIDLAPA